jgi:hypothetical protein
MKPGKVMCHLDEWLNEACAMRNQIGRVQRQGQVYRFSLNGIDYAAFVWVLGTHFRGRIEGHPDVPECSGHTALEVRDALKLWLSARAAA